MRNQSFIFFVISALLLGACGKMDLSNQKAAMSESQALDTLTSVPMSDFHAARGNFRSSASFKGLEMLIKELIASGKLVVPSASRNAVTGAVDLSQLTNLFSLLGGGQANSILGLASGLSGLAGGNTGAVTGGLSGIMALLNAALPIITAIAPQYAPIVMAITTILPLVLNVFSMFKKRKTPVPAPSAAVFRLVPTLA